MNEIYGGLVSNLRNQKDTYQDINITYTFGGTPVTNKYCNIDLHTDPSQTGSVSGGGHHLVGTEITVVATPDAGSDYPEFDGWYEGETKVSENTSYTFIVTGARTLVAKFAAATPIPVEDSLYYAPRVGLAVNSEGKVIVTEGWDESTPLSEVTAKYLSVGEDGGIRVSWIGVRFMETYRINYLNQNGYVVAESYTNTSVTIGGNTWDWSNNNLLTPVPEEYVPSNS